MQGEKSYKKNNIFYILEDIIFYIIIVPLIGLAIVLLFQRFFYPDKIPNVFGYKMFVVLDSNMDQSIAFGDLVFTHNIKPNTLKLKDVVAFRNKMNTVTIHKIIGISKKNDKRVFTMNTARDETMDTKYAEDKNIEGILVKRIAKIGLILWFMQDIWMMTFIICTILIIGLICYYMAQELDIRDMEKLEYEKIQNK